MQISIRAAKKEDALLVADMSRKTFYDTFAAHNKEEDMQLFLDYQFTRAALIAEVEREDNFFFIAFDDDQPAGYVKLRKAVPSGAKEGAAALEIARIYVLEEWIGTGVGKVLMQHCMDIAKQEHVNMIWLGVWEKNERAIRFYQAWGFEKFGEHPFLLGTDLQTDWLMKKLL